MPNQPLINTTVKVTARDINGNNVSKQFNSVREMHFDYADATVNIFDATGSFYFPLTPMTTITYTITPGIAGSHVLVMT